jgi:phosphoribosylamine--glycine ligase
MVSGGYPEAYEKGKVITGLESVAESMVYHAGTSAGANGTVVTSGGRVLAVTSIGHTIEEARNKSYAALKNIQFDKGYYRNDIGIDLMG